MSNTNAGAHLSYGDIRLDTTTDPQFLKVTIKNFKADFSFRRGVQVYLGRTGMDLCLVVAKLNYRIHGLFGSDFNLAVW